MADCFMQPHLANRHVHNMRTHGLMPHTACVTAPHLPRIVVTQLCGNRLEPLHKPLAARAHRVARALARRAAAGEGRVPEEGVRVCACVLLGKHEGNEASGVLSRATAKHRHSKAQPSASAAHGNASMRPGERGGVRIEPDSQRCGQTNCAKWDTYASVTLLVSAPRMRAVSIGAAPGGSALLRQYAAVCCTCTQRRGKRGMWSGQCP